MGAGLSIIYEVHTLLTGESRIVENRLEIMIGYDGVASHVVVSCSLCFV